MFRLLVAVIIGGAVLAFLGWQEMRLASACKAEPKTMTAAELAASGPGDNAHVVLSDYLMCDFAGIFQERKGGGRWQTVWIPVVPVGGEFHQQVLKQVAEKKDLNSLPRLTDFKVLVKSDDVPDAQALERLCAGDTVQGLVINRISSLGSKERKLLQEDFPNLDFDKVYILDHGRTPSGAMTSLAMMGGGGLLSSVGVFGMFRRRG